MNAMIDDISAIKKLIDNFDKPMIACRCGDYAEDTGKTLIKCSCGEVLIYREPVKRVCPYSGCHGACSCAEDAASEFSYE